MTDTQYSGDPFPEPIRVSAGLIVIGLSGNIRTHIFPPRRA
uniref:ORF40k n=1 Tax=Pinus koraiensis TaxID=88728 RepID=Q85WZ2_PINKO|nr:ORF40k [Pinus koraiensis]AAO74077.1 ORF40k [Pinus koraiensis]